MFAFLFAGLLLPMFSRLLEAKKSIKPLFDLSAKLLLTGAWTVTISTIFYPEFILNILYDAHTAEAAAVLPWVMMSAFLFSMQYVTGTLITASGNMRTLILLAGGGMLYNLLLNLLFVPEQGAVGAAKAACFMQFVVLVGQVIHVQSNYRTLGRNLSLSLLTFLVIAPVAAVLLRLTGVPDYIQLIALISICFITAFALKMIHLTDLRMLLQQREADAKDTAENS
jgi:O-antigen/teichoic acid export membrane protein